MTWTPELIQRVHNLRSRNFTYERISQIIGCTKNEVISKARLTGKRQSSPRKNMPERIRETVARRSWELGYDPRDILSDAVYREVSRARHEVMREVRDTIVMPNGRPPSWPQIGGWFGRDHTSVIYGVKKARAMR